MRSLFLPIPSTDVHCLVQLRKMHAERHQSELVSGCCPLLIFISLLRLLKSRADSAHSNILRAFLFENYAGTHTRAMRAQ